MQRVEISHWTGLLEMFVQKSLTRMLLRVTARAFWSKMLRNLRLRDKYLKSHRFNCTSHHYQYIPIPLADHKPLTIQRSIGRLTGPAWRHRRGAAGGRADTSKFQSLDSSWCCQKSQQHVRCIGGKKGNKMDTFPLRLTLPLNTWLFVDLQIVYLSPKL